MSCLRLTLFSVYYIMKTFSSLNWEIMKNLSLYAAQHNTVQHYDFVLKQLFRAASRFRYASSRCGFSPYEIV
jgi:hypothetical protein